MLALAIDIRHLLHRFTLGAAILLRRHRARTNRMRTFLPVSHSHPPSINSFTSVSTTPHALYQHHTVNEVYQRADTPQERTENIPAQNGKRRNPDQQIRISPPNTKPFEKNLPV